MPQDPKPQRKHEAEFQAWKRANDPAFQAWKAAKSPPPEKPESIKDRAEGLLRHAYQGLTFGLGDKIMGAQRRILPEALGGTKKGTTLDEAVKAERGELERFRTKHPYASSAADAIGSIPPMLATSGAGILAKAPTVARTMKAGAGFGALRGAGESAGETSLEDYLANTATSGAVGAVAGATMHGAVRAPRAAMDWLGLRPSAATTSKTGTMALRAGVAPREERTLETVLDKLRQSGKTPSDVTAVAADAKDLGKPMTLPDIVGKPMQRLMRGAQGIPSKGADDIQTALETRRQGASSRVAGDVEAGMGQVRQDVFEATQKIAERQKASASPHYERAMQAGPVQSLAVVPGTDRTLATLWQRPSIQRAAAMEAALAKEEGRPANPVLIAMGKAQKAYSMETLHTVKLRLDEMLGYARGRGQLPDGTPATKEGLRAIQDTKNDLLKIMDTHSKDYAQGRSIWAGEAELQDALEFGRSFLTGGRSQAQLASELGEFSAAGRDQARIGIVDAVRSKIDDAPDGADVARRIFGNTTQRERLRAAFPDDQAFARFERQMKMEATMAKTEALPGGSQTAEKFQDMADVSEPLASPGNLFTVRGALNAVLRTGDRARMGRLAKQKVDALAPYLTAGSGAKGTRTLEDVLGEMAQFETRQAPSVQRGAVVRAVTAGAAGRRAGRP